MGSFKDYNSSTGRFDRLLYTTVARDGDLKLVVSTGLEKNIRSIEKAHSPSSVYAILKPSGKIKSIHAFDKKGEKIRQIDMDKEHKGIIPHVHVFTGEEKYHPKHAVPCTKEDLELIKRAETLLEAYKK